MLDSKDILKTLIELLESQEKIKVIYEIGGNSNGAVPTSEKSA